ncbi:MAG: hypothetical protein E7613_01010 [Ruminococcaceae bacterium]|nr:hypothetical protein [Oscillospiraceae bacterium]
MKSNNIQNNNRTRRRSANMKKRKAIKRRLILITAIIYVFLLLSVLFTFSISLVSCEEKQIKYDIILPATKSQSNGDSVEITDEKAKKEIISSEQLYFDDVLYLPLSVLEKLTDIKIAGDKNKLAFILESNGEHAKFIIDSTDAEVNSNKVSLSGKSIMLDGELYVPFDFFEKYMRGFDLEINKEEETYTITVSTTTEPQFILKAPAQTLAIEEKNVTEITTSPIDFVLDLSSYEEYMNPSDRDAFLFIVSKDSPLQNNYVPSNLTGTIFTRSDRETRLLSKYACLALEAFLKEGEANGITGVTVTSAYRSYEEQSELFQQEIQITGSSEQAAKNVNPPGTSEHQTGLAVDMHNMPSASTAFGETKAAKWLATNAHKFGYILRYPANKTYITGINYEPWHFRYVGRYHATKMYELGLCLEEYLDYINQ